MRVGIITYHRAINYGAFLQAYALCNRLNMDGIDTEIIDYRMIKERNQYQPKFCLGELKHPVYFVTKLVTQKKLLLAFQNAMEYQKLSKNRIESDDTSKFQEMVKENYEIIITGSDEVWKTNGFRGFPTPYWLMGDLGCYKMSYAASARNDISSMSIKDKEMIHNTLEEFIFIGVRDNKTKSEIEKILHDKEINLCCDPTFLWDFDVNPERGKDIIRKQLHREIDKPIISIMTENISLAQKIKKIIGKEFEVIALYNPVPGCDGIYDINPFEWIDVISASDVVLTSFFHAVCFALKCGTPFWAFGTDSKKDKVIEVLDWVDQTDSYIYDINQCIIAGELLGLIREKISQQRIKFKSTEKMNSGYLKLLEVVRQLEHNDNYEGN